MPRVLCHEASHVLGLTKNTVHGDGPMIKSVVPDLSPALGGNGVQVRAYDYHFDICDECKADLREAKAGPPIAVKLQGPALVRTERNYRVVLLPDVVYCDLAPFQPFDWRFIRPRRKRTGGKTAKSFSTGT